MVPRNFGGADNRTPPSWDPSWQSSYPFVEWKQDVETWAMATDLNANQQAPSVVLQLGGAARLLAREIPAAMLQNGNVMDLHDGFGPRHCTGLECLLRGLERRFAPLDQERAVVSMS